MKTLPSSYLRLLVVLLVPLLLMAPASRGHAQADNPLSRYGLTPVQNRQQNNQQSNQQGGNQEELTPATPSNNVGNQGTSNGNQGTGVANQSAGAANQGTGSAGQAANPSNQASDAANQVANPSVSPAADANSSAGAASAGAGNTGSTENSGSTAARSVAGSRNYGEMEDYRRSSLCLIMLTHQDTKYAEEMEEQFLQMPLPERYNPHNVSVRVVSTRHGKLSGDEIARILNQRGVAKELVQQWFDYNPRTQTMDMDRIHARGGYNATYADVERAGSTERGMALLSDEGVELIQNTFVLVCDMSYYDRANTGRVLAAVFAGLSAGLEASARQQAQQGNYQQAQQTHQASDMAMMGAVISSDIGGFSVKMYAHLFRLKWDDNLTQKMFGQYWVDSSMSAAERRSRVQAFENDSYSFQLEYIGKYKAKTGKTVFQSRSQLLQVISNVCNNTIDEGMRKLAKSYPIFRPKTAFFCDGGTIHAYIGRKEGVTGSSQYEVVQKQKKKGQFVYKAVGQATPYRIWDNRNVNMSQVDFTRELGTTFRCKKSNVCDRGYLLREKK